MEFLSFVNSYGARIIYGGCLLIIVYEVILRPRFFKESPQAGTVLEHDVSPARASVRLNAPDVQAESVRVMAWRIYWNSGEPWSPKAAEPISESTTMRVARRLWGGDWESPHERRAVKLDWEDVAYLNGLSDGGDEQTEADAEALIDAIFVYGEITLELREEQADAIT